MLFCVFCVELSLHLPSFKVRGLQMTLDFPLVQINIGSRHSDLNSFKIQFIQNLFQFCSPFCYLSIALKWREKESTQKSHQRETIHDKFAIFAKLERQKKANRVA